MTTSKEQDRVRMAGVKLTVAEIASSSDGLSVLAAVVKAAALWRDAQRLNDVSMRVMQAALNASEYETACLGHVRVNAEYRTAEYALIESLEDVQP
jgi:hypothetical protein